MVTPEYKNTEIRIRTGTDAIVAPESVELCHTRVILGSLYSAETRARSPAGAVVSFERSPRPSIIC
jgi:hypothetical protein